MPRLGLCFTGQPYSIRQVVQVSQEAERLGFDSIWVAEDSWTGRDAVTVLTAISMNTSRIRVGTCLVGASTRHPVLTAMTFNSLREFAAGRLVLGVGLAAGWLPMNDGGSGWAGDSQLRTMRSTVTSLRSLLSGGAAPWGDGSRGLMVPRPWFEGAIVPDGSAVPVFMGAVGPRMTQLAGEVADGLLLEMESLRHSIPPRLRLFSEGARSAGRDARSLEVVKLIATSVATGRAQASQNLLGWATKSVALLKEDEVTAMRWDLGRTQAIKNAWARSDWVAGKDLMTPEMIDAFVALGTADHVRTIIRETVRSGVTLPVLIPYGGDVAPIISAGAEYIRNG